MLVMSGTSVLVIKSLGTNMNEIVKKLLEESTYDVLGVKQVDQKKFAELIVQECVNVLNHRFMGDLNREDMEVRRCVEDVKKHFGVSND